MKTYRLLLSCSVLGALLTCQVYAQFGESFTVSPKYPDLVPGDGIMDAGTWANPLEIESDDYSAPSFEVKSKYPDLIPNDGLMDAGTWANPWQVEEE